MKPEQKIEALEKEIAELNEKLRAATNASQRNYELAIGYGNAVRQQAVALAALGAIISTEPGRKSYTFSIDTGYSSWAVAE